MSVRTHLGVVQEDFDWTAVDVTVDNLSVFLELGPAHKDIVRRAQQESYPEEMERLKASKPLRRTSTLLGLTPFLDQDGLMRLGGRIDRVKLPYDCRHPLLLSGRHPLSRLLVLAFHERLRHAGTDFVLSHIRQHFWMTGGREAVKKIRWSCRRCILHQGKSASQLMGDLPGRIAVDYFGPFTIGLARNRTAKHWDALITCPVTRGVYLDLTTTLSTDDFLLILRRFIGIYGRPTHLHTRPDIYSDNGTNFVGVERELREAVDALHGDPSMPDRLQKEGIRWHFQPANTPHFGGTHEALVRSTKKALYAALDKEGLLHRHPTEDVLRTLLFEVAGLLNTQPLTANSSDPEDLRPLTRNDFLNRPPTIDNPVGRFNFALPKEHYRFVQR